MNSRDRRLGMHKAITRRDFLNGAGVAIGASMLPARGAIGASRPDHYYPPAATGMRGAHAGSFEAAHAAVQGQQWPHGKSREHYDLVVVGAGISGLSAAYIYRRDIDPDARILILDNHDDFGGHAKRNEFRYDGRTYIGYGGTMLIEAPTSWPAVSTKLIRELGVDTARHAEFHHDNLSPFSDSRTASFFDRETFGADYLATGGTGYTPSIEDAPLSAGARRELERLFADRKDYLAGMPPDRREALLRTSSWRDYLARHAGIGDEVLSYIQKWPHGVWAIGADALPAWMADLVGYPGFGNAPTGEAESGSEAGDDDYFTFPDGNATIARLLVRKLVTGVAPGNSMVDVVTAPFDYSKLDRDTSPVRIRLNSTVVDLRHRNGSLDADVDLTCVDGGDVQTVSGSKVVWAGYHAMLPHVCPDLPEAQSAALGASVRAPLVYTNVLIRDRTSLAELDVNRVYCPGSFFQTVMSTHAASFGDYRFSESPEQPLILHLGHVPLAPGLPAAEQFRAGRQQLLGMPFEDFERNVRDQLGRVLGPGGFDPAEDIRGITVNRWPHGYAYSMDAASGDIAWWPEKWLHGDRPWVNASQPVGNIAIAGTDAASNAMTESAIEEAHRSVHALAR